EAIDEALSETASLPERNIEPTTQETPASVDEHTLSASNINQIEATGETLPATMEVVATDPIPASQPIIPESVTLPIQVAQVHNLIPIISTSTHIHPLSFSQQTEPKAQTTAQAA
ncbi:unnamed protein product, partial [Urochloa humidicola]